MSQDSAEEINSSQSLPNNSLLFQIDPEFKNLIPLCHLKKNCNWRQI
jgi:hypothetical protein